MRRKVIQDFANVFCQKFIQLPSGYDLASFVYYGSGNYYLDILNEISLLNEQVIPNLETCKEHKKWLLIQSENHNISFEEYNKASLKIFVKIRNKKIEESFGHTFGMTHFTFECESEIKTNEKTYSSKMSHEQRWGFDWYYEQLYGSLKNLKK